MALQRVRHFKKAMAYALHKWDDKKLTPKLLGTTIDYVIYCVREKIYIDLVVLSKDDDNGDDEENSTDVAETEMETTNFDDANNEEENDYANQTDDENAVSKNSRKHVMPSDYIFPSFFAFIVWGPFVPADKRLSFFFVQQLQYKHRARQKRSST